MDNQDLITLRVLELDNQAKSQDLSAAYQRIANLEQQVADLTGTDSTYTAPEDQVTFIRKIAASTSKFAKEAQDIINAIDNPPTPVVDPAPVNPPVDPAPVDPTPAPDPNVNTTN